MGVSMSAVCGDDMDSDYPTPEIEELSKEEIEMILESWKTPAQKLIDSGEAILFKFLERYPINQAKFNAFRNMPLLSLKGAPGFRTHASRIMNIFASSIDCLDKENGLPIIAMTWTEVGKDHIKRKVTRHEFMQIRGVILDVLTELCHLNEDQQTAWSKLLSTIYHFIFTGLGDP